MYVPEAQDSEWLLGVGRLAMWSRELHHKKGDFEMPCIEQWRGGRNNDRTVKLINNMIGLLFNKLLSATVALGKLHTFCKCQLLGISGN